MKEGISVTICCVVCHIELKNDDVIVLDDFYTLWHKHCFRPDISCSIDTDTYRNMISKYWFFRDRLLQYQALNNKKRIVSKKPLAYKGYVAGNKSQKYAKKAF